MTIKNRISSLETTSNPKELSKSHPLSNLGIDDCKSVLAKVVKAEKNL